ncbi:MAG: copper amine oxidase N-terminal domain-containing protein [Tissierellia bacterium]|nr:copper amine oxidase N-terminal domain-containing protein [Tissierellia bacterium]
MKGKMKVLLPLLLLLVLPLMVAMKPAQPGGEAAGGLLSAIVISAPGADPVRVAAASEEYLVLEHHLGLLILDPQVLTVVDEIPAEDIGLKTQGDQSFSYSLDGDRLLLERATKEGGAPYSYDLAQGKLTEGVGEAPQGVESPRALTAEELKGEFGAAEGQGLQGKDWTFALIPDLNEVGQSQLRLKNAQGELTTTLADLAREREDLPLSLNGKALDAKGFSSGGKLHLPLRAIMEGAGYEVEWQAEDGSIVLKKASDELLLKRGDGQYSLTRDGKTLAFDYFLREDRTYIGQKFFGALDLDVAASGNDQRMEVKLQAK